MTAMKLQPMYTCRPCFLRLLFPLYQTRAFTTSRTRLKGKEPLPTFIKTSSPILDELFATWRSNIVFPARLPDHEREMIYRTKYHALLKSNDPPCAAVGGEFIQMRPLNRLRDEPGTEASLAKVLDLMKEDKDWNNFPEFLSCLRMANRKLRDWQVEKIARRACMAGKEDVLLECVRRVKRTRISLGDVNVARELMWVAMRRTQVGSWKESHIQRGINLAEQLWVMMHDPSHSKEHEPGIVRPLGRPEIIGVLVQLHAAKASMCKNGQDEEGKVKKYVEILLAVWKDSEPSINEGDWSDANHKLLLWSPVLHGIKMARQVLGEKSGNGKALKVKLDALEPLLQKARDLVLAHQPDDSPRRGLKVYEELSSVSS